MTAGDDLSGTLAQKAHRYSSIKYCLAISQTVFFLLLLVLFIWSGASRALAADIAKLRLSGYLTLPVYLFAVSLAYSILSFPITFYQGFIIEHQFGLSRQGIGPWFIDQIKSGAIAYLFAVLLLGLFYFIVGRNPGQWWWIVSIAWFFFNVILARLAPVLIIPLFFKCTKLADEGLRQRIIKLAASMKICLLDVFEINLSKKTVKANAGLTGWGKSRRVILADTLKADYTADEIEVILAHEFSHYKLKHMIKLILLNSAATLLGFYLIFKTGSWALSASGLGSWLDIQAMPLIFVYFTVFSLFTQPCENYFSRRFERQADSMALQYTGMNEAFISAMDKLGRQNLADRDPRPLIKFFFFDHPPISERIAAARRS
ncbi:MAG: M48 family metallopeptidase [Candidatus Omnitrophica bacterium]|jgi:STE24 endopeptidase|nr:M48 family metallopeptidase [Candidatus Omnitrophota bacterium]MDD5079507.1 M48 family metallopeptidase [Candidatus Omnitrophota bacterium]